MSERSTRRRFLMKSVAGTAMLGTDLAHVWAGGKDATELNTPSRDANVLPRIIIGEDYILLHILEDVEVRLVKEGNLLKGIGAVTIRQVPLRGVGAPLIMPEISIFRGNALKKVQYETCTYVKHQREQGKIIIQTVCQRQGEAVADRVDWVFEPKKMQVNASSYIGFSYFYDWQGNGKIAEIMEPSSWEIGGTAVGNRILRQAWIQKGLIEEFIEKQSDEFTPEQYDKRFAIGPAFNVMQPFIFQASSKGSLLIFPDRVCYFISRMNKAKDEDLIRYQHTIRSDFNEGSPKMNILFSPVEGLENKYQALNEWTAVFDAVGKFYCGKYGLREADSILPTAFIHPDRYSSFQECARGLSQLQDAAEKHLHTHIWESGATLGTPGMYNNPAVVWELVPARARGGAEGFAQLCDTAHRLGMKVTTWFPAFHMSNKSPLIAAHPEWIARDLSGKPITCGYKELIWLSLRSEGYFTYLLESFKKLRELGLDGMMFDSFVQPANMDYICTTEHPEPALQVREMILLFKTLQEYGYTLLWTEGCTSGGPFGDSGYGFGNWGKHEDEGREYAVYRWYVDVSVNVSAESHFRLLANKGVCLMSRPAWGSINNAYNRVRNLMQERYLLDGNGVEWQNDKSRDRVLFSFTRFNYKVPSGKRVLDLTEENELKVRGILPAQPYHVYWVGDNSEMLRGSRKSE
ncbi:MAG: alpha-galactosidase [Armatimonadetes bacterium]|nr:alpha-galactosidase [Armatimonadota bacterium]